MTPQEIINTAVQVLDKKKAHNIVVLDVEELTSLAKHFVIASGNSTTQVDALSQEVLRVLKEQGVTIRKEEQRTKGNSWVLLDYNDVLIHIFYQPTREYYNLEELWADAPRQDISALITE